MDKKMTEGNKDPFNHLSDYLKKHFADREKKQDKTIVYDGGYIRLTRGGLIEIDHPQESLIKEIRCEKEMGNEFHTFLIPHRMDAENLTKIYDAINAANTTEKNVDLETAIGLSHDGTIDGDGCFLNSVEINDEGRQEVLYNNERLKEHRILGKSRLFR
jgi:hypothetical protein